MKNIMYKSKKIISCFIALLMFVLTLTSHSSMNANAVNSTKWYTIFDAQTGFSVGGYSLDANPLEDNSRDFIVVDDGRYSDNTIIGAVKIITNKGRSTGFIVDDHTIGTAAHCVFDITNGTLEDSKVVIEKILILDSDGNVDMTITDAYDVHIPNAYVSSNGSSSYDYAMITINTELGENYQCFNLGAMTDDMFDSDIAVFSTGFPGKVNGNTVNTGYIHNKYTDYGKIVSVQGETGDEVFYYDIGISGGNSGGPIYIKSMYGEHQYLTVIGIVSVATSSDGTTYLRGGGVRMTTNLLHFYKNNPNIAYIEEE